jgi:hypothetical protein
MNEQREDSKGGSEHESKTKKLKTEAEMKMWKTGKKKYRGKEETPREQTEKLQDTWQGLVVRWLI